jgi:hypothetical protein
MKTLAYSLLLFLIGGFSLQASTYAVEQDKVIEKSFPIKADGTLNISNKYGSVDITDWDKNEISIKVTIVVKTSNQSKADDIFDRIDIKFNNSKSFVSAETEIESNKSWFGWTSWLGKTEYQINYEVKMPQSVHLKCKNRYGDTFITDLNNGAELEIKYGNMRMGSVEGSSTIDVGYSSIDFGDVGDMVLIAKYSSVKGSSAQTLRMDTKYSDCNFGDVKNINSESKYDEFVIDRVEEISNDGKYDSWEINEVVNFSSETKYTDIEIAHLKGDLDVEQDFGSIRVRKIDCSNLEINLELKYTDVNLDTKDCGNLDIVYNGEYTDLNLAQDLKDQLKSEGKSTWLEAGFGSRSVKMKVDMKYGDLRIK